MQPMDDKPRPRRNPLLRYAPFIGVAVVIAVVALFLAGNDGDGKNGAAKTSGTASRLPLTYARAKADGKHVDFGPNCDATTGRIKIPSTFAPPCVAPFKGDNGGATAQGITADTITVALYLAQPDPLQQAIVKQAGALDTPAQTEQTYRDYVAFFEQHYETYGRHVKLVPIQATGAATDDAAAKADAIKVATEIKAFAAWGGPTQTNAYADELAARGVLCITCATSQPDSFYVDRAPYVWGYQPSPEQGQEMVSEYIVKRLKGGKAAYAGDNAFRSRTRRFGFLHYETPTGLYSKTASLFRKELRDGGITIVADAQYFLEVSRAQEIARTLVAKMKNARVTTIIFGGDPFIPIYLTREATAQNYFPEWVITGTVLTDTTILARLYDQKQWAHAFGVSVLVARSTQRAQEPYNLHVWQFGRPPVAHQYGIIYPQPFIFYTGVHLAGPRLTPQTFRDALFSYPVTGGRPKVTNLHTSWGNHHLFHTGKPDFLASDDSTEIWWDPKARGEDEIGQQGTGMYRYVDGGKRYLPGQWPRTPARPFDPKGAVALYDTVPQADRPPDYPGPT